MSMQALLEAFKLIEQNIEKCDFEKEPKSSKLIEHAEEALGLKFPPTYRLFLERYGCGGLGGLEVYGIINDDFEIPGVPDAISLTLHERKKWGLPYHFIYISNVGDGFYYLLDSSQANAEEEYPVVVWTYGMAEKDKKKINTDFGEFLLEQFQDSLKNYDEE